MRPMKVNGPSSTQSASRAGRKPAAGGSGSTFTIDTPTETGASTPAGGIAPIHSVDAILTLQGVGDAMDARKKATGRALNMLDVLDELKLALLEGGLPKAKLEALMRLLQSRRDATQDETLERVLDEVETRAAVELAKFG